MCSLSANYPLPLLCEHHVIKKEETAEIMCELLLQQQNFYHLMSAQSHRAEAEAAGRKGSYK